MKTQASLIRTDRAVKLDAVALVHVHVALIVHPGHAEKNGAFGLDKAFQKPRFFIGGIGVDGALQTVQHLGRRLVELRLVGILLFQTRQNALYIRHG